MAYRTSIHSLAVGDGFLTNGVDTIYCCCGTTRIRQIKLPADGRIRILSAPAKDVIRTLDLECDNKQQLGNFAHLILKHWPKRKFKYSNKGFIRVPYGLSDEQLLEHYPPLRKRTKV